MANIISLGKTLQITLPMGIFDSLGVTFQARTICCFNNNCNKGQTLSFKSSLMFHSIIYLTFCLL